jgi:hypothetical protein
MAIAALAGFYLFGTYLSNRARQRSTGAAGAVVVCGARPRPNDRSSERLGLARDVRLIGLLA